MTARLYVGTYAKYNAGSIRGAWLDLEDYADRDAFLAACAELHKDEADPELMFQDYEGFPRGWYCESSAPPEELWQWLELSETQQTVLQVYQENISDSGTIAQAEEAYYGTFKSEEEFAEELWTETADIPDNLIGYIDWERVARDLRADYSMCDHDGQVWVFRNI
jgi:antirestriction protein